MLNSSKKYIHRNIWNNVWTTIWSVWPTQVDTWKSLSWYVWERIGRDRLWERWRRCSFPVSPLSPSPFFPDQTHGSLTWITPLPALGNHWVGHGLNPGNSWGEAVWLHQASAGFQETWATRWMLLQLAYLGPALWRLSHFIQHHTWLEQFSDDEKSKGRVKHPLPSFLPSTDELYPDPFQNPYTEHLHISLFHPFFKFPGWMLIWEQSNT